MVFYPLVAIFNFDFIYLFLNLFLLYVFRLAGANVSRGNSFWKNAVLCSICFTLVMGSRYNRGNDYAHYVDVYVHGEHENQILFWYLNYLMREVAGIGKYCIFYIYSIPFILSAFKLLSNYKEYSKYTFPLLLIAMTYFEEYEIRQALGFSFIFLFLDVFLSYEQSRKTTKIIQCFILSICTMLVHSANIIFIIVFILVYYSYSNIIPFKLSIPLLIFSTYFFIKIYDISYLMPALQFMGSINGKFGQYTEGNAAEAWFGESAYQLENERNPIIQFFEVVGNSSLFYFSYKIFKLERGFKGRGISTLSNLYIIGFCGKQAFVYLEILSRMSGLFQRMWFVPMTIVLSQIQFAKLNFIEKLMFISMIFVVYDYLKYLFFPENGMTSFLWDNF